MEKTMLRRVMVGLTIVVIVLGVANFVKTNISTSNRNNSFKSSVTAAEISELVSVINHNICRKEET